MKMCYVDESGNQDADPIFVMVGILADIQRLNKTREEFGDIFAVVQKLFRDNLQELKGSKMIFGRDRWRTVDAQIRKDIAEHLVEWISERKHTILISAIDRKKLKLERACPQCCTDIWLAAGLHIALQVQKMNQTQKGNKGHTFLVFDDNKQKADQFAELLWEPPDWTDDYYGRSKKELPLNQVIDTAFTIRSHHAGLVQVADLYAFIIRRYAEMKNYDSPETWNGERELIDRLMTKLSVRLSQCSVRWPKRPSCDCASFYNRIAPQSLLAL